MKITSNCNITSCIACKFVIKRKFNILDSEYGFYFTRETVFFVIFLTVLRTRENIKKILSHAWTNFIEYPLITLSSRHHFPHNNKHSLCLSLWNLSLIMTLTDYFITKSFFIFFGNKLDSHKWTISTNNEKKKGSEKVFDRNFHAHKYWFTSDVYRIPSRDKTKHYGFLWNDSTYHIIYVWCSQQLHHSPIMTICWYGDKDTSICTFVTCTNIWASNFTEDM